MSSTVDMKGARQARTLGGLYVVPVLDVFATYLGLALVTTATAFIARSQGYWLDVVRAGSFEGILRLSAVVLVGGTIAAVLNSLMLHRLGLFVHTGSHWEFSPIKARGDSFFRLFVGSFFGLEIEEYRKKHLAHHRLHGQDDDPEDQYTLRFSFTRVVDVLRSRDSLKKAEPAAAEAPPRSRLRLIAMSTHLIICVVLALTVDPIFAGMAWAVPVMIGLPLSVYVRNYCEHHPGPDGSKVSREFSAGPFSLFLGAAGFRYHNAHHLAPGVLYWNLGKTSEAPPRGYAATFLMLLRSPKPNERTSSNERISSS